MEWGDIAGWTGVFVAIVSILVVVYFERKRRLDSAPPAAPPVEPQRWRIATVNGEQYRLELDSGIAHHIEISGDPVANGPITWPVTTSGSSIPFSVATDLGTRNFDINVEWTNPANPNGQRDHWSYSLA